MFRDQTKDYILHFVSVAELLKRMINKPAEWVAYTGSDEQIDEIKANIHGYLVRDALGMLSSRVRVAFDLDGVEILPFEYLICNPHPLADMICQQARTGQPVYWRSIENGGTGKCHEYFPPFAYPNEFEYSFTPFED